MVTDTHKETLGFQAEVKQLLDLMIHSLYSNKEIFMRELISNASDAIDHLRFAMLSDETIREEDSAMNIHVAFDKEARTITISDNGIGMNREEVVENIGTIARSGTREFFQSLTGDQKKDASLIGQFGVGFYSAFVVAERVTLVTRRAGLAAEQGVRWESDGAGEYTLETIEKATRGTDVILHLRENESELLDGNSLRTIIRKYSDHIMVPILMLRDKQDTEEQEEGVVEEKPEEEQVNKASALWTRSKNEISEEEYNELYRHISHDFGNPLAYVHSRMEGTYEYTLLLYIPERAPFDLWVRERRQGMKLYVRRVFIMDDAEQLMPNYLRFIRGIVDSNDLPLNVSREILQHNRLIETIRSNSVKKVLSLLSDLANNNKEKYATFWKEFGRALKEGLVEDPTNRENIAKLLRFASTHNNSDVQDVSFEDYIGRMKEGQDKIYYISAESYAGAKDSPLLEIFKKKGIEVLLLSDAVDYLIGVELNDFQGKQLQSVSKGAIDLSKLDDAEGEATNDEGKESIGEGKDLLEHLKKVLDEKVKEVRITTRLTSSPACLVVDEYDIDPNLQRLLKASGQTLPATKPILEINPHHPIILKLQHEENEDKFGNWAYVLYDQSVLSLGEQLENPISFVNRLNELLQHL